MAPNCSKPVQPTGSCLTLDAVHEDHNTHSFVVRLLRTWEARDFKRNNVLLSVECLFVDEKAQTIQASIHPRCLHKFKAKLAEGGLFSLAIFDAKKQCDNYRLSDHAYKVYFTDQTMMTDVPDSEQQIPDQHFRISSFEDAKKIVDKGVNLPDIVAQVTIIRTFTKVDATKTPPRTTFNLQLTCTFSCGGTAYVSTWGKQAQNTYDEIMQLAQGPVVVIVTGVNPRTIKREFYLNTTASSRFFFNTANNIVSDFRLSTHYQESLLPLIVKGNNDSSLSETRTIGDILDFVRDQGGEEQSFWCKAKVVDVILTTGWFFVSCTGCSKKMTKTGGRLECQGCHSDKAVGSLRFRVEIIVDDGLNTTTFVLFDDAAEPLLNSKASLLAAELDVQEGDDCGDVPKIIKDLVGRELLFHIKVAKYNYTARYQSFSVSETKIPETDSTSEIKGATTNKKRTTSCASNKAVTIKPDTKKIEEKADGKCQEVKKPRLRRNRAQIVDEVDDEAVQDPQLED